MASPLGLDARTRPVAMEPPVSAGSEHDTTDDIGTLHEAIRAVTHLDPTDRLVEVVAAAVLALATIASAWSAYQATRWGGVQAAAFAEAGALRAESVRASDLADAELTIDVEYFAIWLDGASQGNDTLQQRVEDSFRPEFVPAFEAWQATDPVANPEAPHTPFEMDEYQIAASREADELREQAEDSAQEALDANQNGDNYVLTTVLFASVLFFAGISTKFQGRRVKLTLVGLGLTAFIAGASILVTFPVH
jgi:hypothetical protein